MPKPGQLYYLSDPGKSFNMCKTMCTGNHGFVKLEADETKKHCQKYFDANVCGEGTVKNGKQCVPDEEACGPGTRFDELIRKCRPR